MLWSGRTADLPHVGMVWTAAASYGAGAKYYSWSVNSQY